MTLEPHHAAARTCTDDEHEALIAIAHKMTRRATLARLRPTVAPDVEARAHATVAHLRNGQP